MFHVTHLFRMEHNTNVEAVMERGKVPGYRKGECSRCGKEGSKSATQRYCKECKAIKQAEYRGRLKEKLDRLAAYERLEAMGLVGSRVGDERVDGKG